MLRGALLTAALTVTTAASIAAGYFLWNSPQASVRVDGSWSEFFVQVAATVLGAAIAAFVAFKVADNERKAARRDAAFRCVMKVSLIINEFNNVLSMIDESLNTMNDQRQTHRRMFERVKPIVGLSAPITFDASELAPFHEGGEQELANEIIQLSMRHHSVVETLLAYSELRRAMQRDLPVTSVAGEIVTSAVPPAEAPRFEVRAMELETLIRPALAALRSHYLASLEIGDRIGPAAKRALGVNKFPGIQLKSDHEIL